MAILILGYLFVVGCLGGAVFLIVLALLSIGENGARVLQEVTRSPRKPLD